jgi:opacity protein-like surface antigen
LGFVVRKITGIAALRAGNIQKMRRIALATALLSLFLAAPVGADATLFIGANTTPDNRAVRGGAFGAGLLIIGFEGEYAFTSDEPSSASPSLTTGSGNVYFQTPVAVLGLQPYFTTGAGLYREKLGTRQDTNFALNTGGGVKITLVGPLRLRVDYRVFKLGNGALYSPAHRIYAGMNLKF